MTRPTRPWRAALAALALLAAGAGLARPAAADQIVVAGSTDIDAMAPVLTAFEALYPEMQVIYHERETVGLYEEVLDGSLLPPPDVVISSATDLQIRLVNDGFSRPHVSEATRRLPDWAIWRDEAFGFTFEPLVFVTNPAEIAPADVPRTRERLAALVSGDPAFRGRVATYDIRQSGIGYLMASFDQSAMSDFWPFVARVAEGGLMTACCAGEVVELVASGKAAVGYNVLGSYAHARKAAGAPIEIVYPEDFMFVIARVAFIMKDAPNAAAAELFVDFLLSEAAQRVFAHESMLSAIDPAITDGLGQTSIRAAARGPIRPIPLNAALLGMTDPLRRQRFVDLWSEVTGKAPAE